MGWQRLSSSLRRWDGGAPSRELEAAVEEVLQLESSDALQIFSEALDPSLQRGTDFLTCLPTTEGAKCRCDAVWYGDTIAYGCKTCGLSSASCICVSCFEAGDHEGHDFYISRSDYGCCDCGDAHAWRPSGFCRHHPGPRKDVDSTQLLPKKTRQRAKLLIPAQVKHLVAFQPSSSSSAPADSSGSTSTEGNETAMIGPSQGTAYEVPPPPLPPGKNGGVRASSQDSAEASTEEIATDKAGGRSKLQRILVTGVNLRVTEEMLREHFATRTADSGQAGGSADPTVLKVDIIRDAETKASKGRAYITMRDEPAAAAALRASGEVLRGSTLRVHAGDEAITAVERHLQAWESHFEWLLRLGGFHDGLRKIIGQVFLDDTLLGEQSAVEALLRYSHLMEPSVRKLETNLMVDLMLDLDFKERFSQVFTRLYRKLVLARAGNQDSNELGDFTCQIFTRQDVTLELVREHDLVRNLLGCLWDLLHPALVQGAVPAVFSHESTIFRDHEIIQCSMDLLYVLDHAEVAHEIITKASLRSCLWEGWVRILIAMQAMNAHERRLHTHVEYATPTWGNALTLHTDLMSNTWLILDAVETKGNLEAVQDLAKATWAELRSWMLHVHFSENRTSAEGLEGVLEYCVSWQPASFHVPVNRVLGLLIHHLCLRSETGEVAGRGRLWEILSVVGITKEADVLWWMEHPLRALVLHSQVSAGMWRRNGEALENENEFYRMNYWHHLLIDMDLLILRLASMLLNPETLFRTLLLRFELHPWLAPGDPVSVVLGSSGATDSLAAGVVDEFAMQKLQSLLLLLHQLLATHTPLAFNFRQMVKHNTRQYLSIGSKMHSQLWDPRLERSTATSTAKDQQMLESALREISTFSEADGMGHTSAKYHLKDDQWHFIDPYFHLFSWSEQQKVEENLAATLKVRRETIMQWLSENAKLQVKPFEVYKDAFYEFGSCALLQAICWLLLMRFAFTHLKDNGSVADGRLLVLCLHLALRSAQTPRSATAESCDEVIDPIGSSAAFGENEVQIFSIAAEMGSHLSVSARKRIRVTTSSFFGSHLRMSVEPDCVTPETDVCLLDAVDRLTLIPEDHFSGGLARSLQMRLLEDPKNRDFLRQRPRPWFAPPQQADKVDIGSAVDANLSGTRGGDGTAEGSTSDEARRAKRRKAAQERQQRMLDDLKKRQAAFMEGAQGQRMLEEVGPPGESAGTGAECVVCMSQQDDQDSDNPIGLLCFLRPAVASCLPRRRVPVEEAVLLQAPRSPAASSHNRGPQCFSPQAPDGLVHARACTHRMHFTCWRRIRPASLASGGGRMTCPYCGTVANALLPIAATGDVAALLLEPDRSTRCELPEPAIVTEAFDVNNRDLQSLGNQGLVLIEASADVPFGFARRHADASQDFSDQLGQQLAKLDLGGVGTEPMAAFRNVMQAFSIEEEEPISFFPLARLCADNISSAEVRWRSRRVPSTGSASLAQSASSGPASSAISQVVLQSIASEALQGAPRMATAVMSLASGGDSTRILPRFLTKATPQGRFHLMVALLLGLCTELSGSLAARWQAACTLLQAFYLAEVCVVLAALGTHELFASELARTSGVGCTAAASVWRLLCNSASLADSHPTSFLPVRTREEAVGVLKLALNPFLAKVRILLSLLGEGREAALDVLAHLGPEPSPDDEHRALSCAEFGLPDIGDLLLLGASATACSFSEQALALCCGLAVQSNPCRGLQPMSPLVLVLVSDSIEQRSLEDEEPPAHVWQMTQESLDRLVASNRQQVVELGSLRGSQGRLVCVAYRVTLPVVTGRVYQRFYTQFSHARCTVCNSSPPIPTLCLMCGTFLCCNSECCRHPGEDVAQAIGEVTLHAQSCGFGTCVFLQLSNSLVHIVADGFIACWGSLYLDGHGEEEYNLARPLHISEARLQQLTQSIREASFDFEPRLKWKKVIFV